MKSPEPKFFRLSNGLKVIYLQTKNDPISAGHIFLPNGTWSEPPAQEGVTVLMLSAVFKGTEKRSARKLAEDTESLGAHINASASHDTSFISCHSIAENFPKALGTMAEVLLTPSFPEEEIEKEKTALLASIKAKKEQISTVAGEEINKRLFGKHPYSRPTSGTVKTVPNLNRRILLERHGKLVIPKNGIFSVASSHPLSEIKKTLEKLFGNSAWPNTPSHAIKAISETTAPKRCRVQLPSNFTQAFLMTGYPAAKARSEDFLCLKLLSGILGAGMSSRLFQSLRENLGLAYEVGAYYPTKKGGSSFVFYLGLEEKKIGEAKAEIQKEISKIKAEEISERELTENKNFVKGSFLLDHQTNGQRSYYLGWWEMLGLGAGFDKKFVQEINKITPAQLQKAARKYFSKDSVTVEVHAKK